METVETPHVAQISTARWTRCRFALPSSNVYIVATVALSLLAIYIVLFLWQGFSFCVARRLMNENVEWAITRLTKCLLWGGRRRWRRAAVVLVVPPSLGAPGARRAKSRQSSAIVVCISFILDCCRAGGGGGDGAGRL